MFSGIVETLGLILNIKELAGCKHFTIAPKLDFDDVKIGDSIAVNGICLTVTQITKEFFEVTAVPQTLRLTNLDHLKINDKVNLERSLKVNSRLGGHYVEGHVDCVGRITALKHDQGDALIATITLPSQFTKYIVAKGYITIDGMSITVIESTNDSFTVTFIPHTQTETITQFYVLETKVNIEVDIMGKYIEKLLGGYQHAIAH